jgi:hypothetical protein
MASWRRAASALTAGTLLVIAPATSHAQAVQRSLYVSVLNDAGAPVPDLGPADFIVREDGVTREVLRVVRATDPMQIAVLVDNSQAARDDIADMRKALQDFVTAMTTGSATSGKNELAIIALADRPTILTDYTSDRAKLLKGVDRIFAMPQSGALLLQGIIEVCQGFKTHEAKRPVIVAVTTEGPELSDRYHDLVLEPLLASGAAFHAIVVGPPGGGTSDAERDRGVVLDRGTRETGGRRDNVLTSMSLAPKLKEVAAELTHQYRVTYAHPPSLIPPEHVTVAAAKAGMTARGTLIKERQQGKP